MRITPEMNIRLMSGAIRTHQTHAFTLQQQIASGRKINRASDDPTNFNMIRHLKIDINLLKQYERNADVATHYLNNVDDHLRRSVNVLHRVGEIATKAGDGTLEQVSRDALADEVDALLETLIGIANSSEGGRYTFAGLRTDTQPFETELHPDTGEIIAVLYRGSEETRMVKTGEAHSVATNLAGGTSSGSGGIFQTQTRDVFDSLIQLRDALRNGDTVTDEGLRQQLTEDLDHMLNNVALNGVRQDQVQMQKIANREIQVQHRKSVDEMESIDIAEAMMRLSETETAYQAALHSTSRLIQQVSLLNFI